MSSVGDHRRCHDAGAVNWACLALLIETAKRHGIDPQTYLADILAKLVNGWPAQKLDEVAVLMAVTEREPAQCEELMGQLCEGLRGSQIYLRNLASRAAFISRAGMALSFKQATNGGNGTSCGR
jgi:hypothetical protein